MWGDDAGVTCRRWNWQQCTRTQIPEHTRTALFMFERLEPMTLDQLHAAGDDLVRHLNAADIRTKLLR
ncbi:hypothetical protein FKR81_02075 [Lentzea tibetensis]|uniref:Uncharacterized protein n=1 Tax=Lentzea tibetensis TaxID=2591470 RepID=A0A563F316_9PSEU|nr:hypothetical protein [Lentzea tibetensis]TWP54357.1 hypothetical protein FKR81_02075 [Lentzea tibetensis]